MQGFDFDFFDESVLFSFIFDGIFLVHRERVISFEFLTVSLAKHHFPVHRKKENNLVRILSVSPTKYHGNSWQNKKIQFLRTMSIKL